MLLYSNPQDRIKMMNYHRTKDMINLLTYFPSISPIRDLTIVETIEEYRENYDLLKDYTGERNDTILSKPSMKSVEGTGKNPNIEEIFKKVKELDKNGVMVLFNLTHEPSERYDRYAGISVGVSLGKGIYIDAVGKGFDGREVSKGITTHERYYIPWFDIRFCCIENFKKYQTYLINNENYSISRKERIYFLTSLNINPEIVEEKIPKNYQPIPDFIWIDIIKNIIKKLEKVDFELQQNGLNEFAISGHTEGKRFLPWQLFDKSRYNVK